MTTGHLTIAGPDSILVHDVVASPNIGERRGGGGGGVRYLILHYTGLPTAARSIEVLCDPACEVSCHYLVDLDGRVTQMVREVDRAWHAGRSCWRGETDINSHSIGIEIQNIGHSGGLPDYPEAQMQALTRLARDIVQRNDMRAEDVLAHSDIAPHRKIDPGENFDWRRLHTAGIGHWAEPLPVSASIEPPINPALADARVLRCQKLLSAYGYDVAESGILDIETMRVICAFQRHFRPARVDGLPDPSTIGTLEQLLAAVVDEPRPQA